MDELVDDSGDEKRIEKAEKAAEHRALKKRRKRGGMGTAGRSRTGIHTRVGCGGLQRHRV